MSKSITLPKKIYEGMVVHAKENFPNEVCGLLCGQSGCVTNILPAHNISPTPYSDYQVDPETLLHALRREEEGDELIAIYHSHPTSAAYPSATDAAKAYYPNSIYLILSLQKMDAPELTGFFLRPELILSGRAATKLLKEIVFSEVRPGLFSVYLPPPIEAHHFEFLPNTLPKVAFYLIFEDNGLYHTPEVRLISVEPVEVIIET